MPVSIKFKEATSAGYSISSYAKTTKLTKEGSDEAISLIAPTDEPSSLTNNTWGFALTQPSSESDATFVALPETEEDALAVKSTGYTETPAGDETIVYYGIYVTPDLPYGTYTGNNIHYDATLNTTTVTLDGNGADSGEMGEYVVPAGKSFMLPQNIYTKTDYVFNGWNTEPSGTGTTYSDQANFVTPSTPENTTLYAQWAHATTISFDSNGSTGGKAMQPIIILAGDTKKLPTNSYTKEGYVLLEWNTERDGTGDFYADEAEFTADATESASITLYARWMKDGPYMQDVATWGNTNADDKKAVKNHQNQLYSFCLVILATPGQHSCNTRTKFL